MRRAALWLAVLAWLAPAMLGHAAPDRGTDETAGGTTGQLLVAAPGIGDPRFAGAVIYMIHHGKDGAFGVAINRPVGEHTIAELLEALGQDGKGVAGKTRIFSGGPMEPGIGFVIHTSDFHDDHTIAIDNRFSFTSDSKILRAIGAGKGPKKSLVAFGYAGWGPGQLEEELSHNDWYVTPADATLLFDEDRDAVWQKAYDKRVLKL
ncbi:MAG TPA: YqgE/AlgH family protein [Stellaceae bacterium]|nr:YqgE/AlgH family protein [Stellaceae bacterium]